MRATHSQRSGVTRKKKDDGKFWRVYGGAKLDRWERVDGEYRDLLDR